MRPRVLAAAAVALSAAAAAPAAAEATEPVVSAGSLRAEVQADPWRLRFVDAVGREVLREASDTGAGPSGPLGFRAAGVWRHATRLLEGGVQDGRFRGTLATTDPLGRRLSVEVAPDGEGVISVRADVLGPTLDVEAVGGGFAAVGGERYLGFGERSNAVDQTGLDVENYVAEGPYQPEERPFIAPFIPPWAYRPTRDDATYYPVPWLLSSAGYGVLVDGAETSAFRLRSDTDDAWSVEVTGPPAGQPTTEPGSPTAVRLRVFGGPRPADSLRRMTAATGRQPPAGPQVFGPWYHSEPGFGDEREILDGLQRADVPLSVGQIFTQYLPCANHRNRRDRQRSRVALLHDRGLAATTYINPMMCTRHPDYGEAVERGALSRRASGEPYTYEFSVRRDTVGQFDFSAPAGRDLFGRLVGEAVADGHDGWMEDYGEYSPLDAHSADGTPGRAMHNDYPTRYHCAAREVTRGAGRELLRYARSGWTGTAPCAPVVWGGDPTTDWGYDGLASAVKNGLSMGLSGVSTWGSDLGGFFALGTRSVTPELLKRWIEFGAVSGVMRAQETGIAVPEKDRPRVFEPEILPVWRRYAKLRTQLHPYLDAADAEYQRTGLPIMRHHALVNPEDSNAITREDQFLFGPDLLAAPVITPDARERRVYLPAGGWVDLWRAARIDEATGALRMGPSRAGVETGAREITVPASLEELPLFARAGAILPLLPADVETLSEYGTDPGIVHLRDRRHRMTLLAFPRGRSSAAFNDGERVRSEERPKRRWTLGIDGARTRTYRLEASLATLRKPFRPCRVRTGGRRLRDSAWSYDTASGVLTATFKLRDGTVSIEGCAAGRPRDPQTRRPSRRAPGRPRAHRRAPRFTG